MGPTTVGCGATTIPKRTVLELYRVFVGRAVQGVFLEQLVFLRLRLFGRAQDCNKHRVRGLQHRRWFVVDVSAKYFGQGVFQELGDI